MSQVGVTILGAGPQGCGEVDPVARPDIAPLILNDQRPMVGLGGYALEILVICG